MIDRSIKSTLKELGKLNDGNFRAAMNFFLGELINPKNKKEISRLLTTALKTPIVIKNIELDIDREKPK